MTVAALGLLSLSDVPRVELREPPLAVALFQVRFEALANIQDAITIAPFHTAIRTIFPRSTIAPNQMHLELNPEGMTQRVGAYQWVFGDEGDVWHVVLAADAMTLETRRYARFDEFLTRLSVVLDALQTEIRPGPVRRVGLRYVNEIRRSDGDWTRVIHPMLLGPLTEAALAGKVVHSLQEVRLAFADGQWINVRQGLVPRGSTVQPPPGDSDAETPFYLLDYDIYQEIPPETVVLLERDVLCSQVQAFHDDIHRLFRWSVTDAYIAEMAAE